MTGTVEQALASQETPDTDMDLPTFLSWIREMLTGFDAFTTKGLASHPDEFKSAQTRQEWQEEFQAYIDTKDGEVE